MAVITVGRLCPEDIRMNRDGEKRWIKGRVLLYGPCRSYLGKIGQQKLPFTVTTGKPIPKEPVILLGELSHYQIPNSGRIWKTLEVSKFITKDSPLFGELGVGFDTACVKIAREDKEFLEKIGALKLRVKEKLEALLGKRNKFTSHLMDLFGDNAYEALAKNPWKMIHIVPYFTIEHADQVAEKMGIPLSDNRRFYEYFRYLMDQSFESHRDTYIAEHEFLALYFAHFSDEMELGEFKGLASQKESPVIRSKLGYHPAHLYFSEKASYEVVERSLGLEIPSLPMEEGLAGQIARAAGMELTGEQAHAVRHAFHTPLHIIRGGPGTGKTTVLNIIVQKLMALTGTDGSMDDAPFLLAAPTGKAAYRMWEQTGVPAHTINSAFGIIPGFGCLNVEDTAKRLSHVRYLIIDESSMLDAKLFGDMCRVLLAMGHLPFLLLVGDENQLPPVQHGQVFKDLLDFMLLAAPGRVTSLTLLKRQAEGSHIPELAAYIKDGQFPDAGWFAGKDDVFLLQSGMDAFPKLLTEQVLAPKAGDISSIQLLTPYRNGQTPDTVHAINKLAAPLYNPAGEKGISCGNPPQTLRIGDKVINRANRTKTIINGSLGHITDINDSPRDVFAWTVTVEFENGEQETYLFEELKQLELAYAITIHASQGSEYETVAACALRSGNPGFLNRNLLYVAVTRAKKRLMLIGQAGTFCRIAQAEQQPRKTALGHWLRQKLERMEVDGN